MWYNIKTIHLTLPKTWSDLQEVKDSMGLKAPRCHSNVGVFLWMVGLSPNYKASQLPPSDCTLQICNIVQNFQHLAFHQICFPPPLMKHRQQSQTTKRPGNKYKWWAWSVSKYSNSPANNLYCLCFTPYFLLEDRSSAEKTNTWKHQVTFTHTRTWRAVNFIQRWGCLFTALSTAQRHTGGEQRYNSMYSPSQ